MQGNRELHNDLASLQAAGDFEGCGRGPVPVLPPEVRSVFIPLYQMQLVFICGLRSTNFAAVLPHVNSICTLDIEGAL